MLLLHHQSIRTVYGDGGLEIDYYHHCTSASHTHILSFYPPPPLYFEFLIKKKKKLALCASLFFCCLASGVATHRTRLVATVITVDVDVGRDFFLHRISVLIRSTESVIGPDRIINKNESSCDLNVEEWENRSILE